MTVPEARAYVRERVPGAICQRRTKWLSHKVTGWVYAIQPSRRDPHTIGQCKPTRGQAWREAAEELQYITEHPDNFACVIPQTVGSGVV
jgi:hypothetical protein